MKNIILIFICLGTHNFYAQEQKETIFLFFDGNSKKTCKVETEYSSDNDGKLDGYKTIRKYRKEFKKGKTIFYICDEKFLFNVKKQKIDTCRINLLKALNIKDINYLKNKYQMGEDFKHHTFKQINIIEKISDNKIVKYLDVYWCCEWTIE